MLDHPYGVRHLTLRGHFAATVGQQLVCGAALLPQCKECSTSAVATVQNTFTLSCCISPCRPPSRACGSSRRRRFVSAGMGMGWDETGERAGAFICVAFKVQ